MSKLEEKELRHALESLTGWRLEDGRLVYDRSFPDFAAAMQFVQSVAALAETMDHHPDIDIRYNKVRLSLISHDVNGLTARDVRFASRLDASAMPKDA